MTHLIDEPKGGQIPLSEHLFATVFESAAVPIKVVDLQTGRIAMANPAFVDLLGFSLDELQAMPSAELIHPDDRTAAAAAHAPLLTGDAGTFVHVRRYVGSDGSALTVRVTGSIVRNAEGTPRYGVSMVQDVTHEKEAEGRRREAERRYRQIVESSLDGIWLVDPQGRTTFANESLATMLGTTAQAMLATSVYDFCDGDLAEEVSQGLGRRRKGIEERFPFRFRRADGRLLDAVISASPIFDDDGTFIGALAIVGDVTELLETQQAYAVRVAQLEAIAELGQAVLAGASVEELLEHVGPAVAAVLDSDLITVLRPAGDGTLTFAAAYEREARVDRSPVDASASQAGYQLANGLPRVIVEDYELEERFTPPPRLRALGMRSGLSCVIDGDEGPFGVLGVHTRLPRRFSDEDAAFVDSVAHLIASVVRRAAADAQRERVEDELRQTADRFRMLADNAQDVVFRFRLGPRSGYEYISPSVEKVTGFRPEDFYADPNIVLMRTDPEDASRILERRHREHNDALTFRFRHRDGRIVWAERRAIYIRDENDEIVAFEGIVRDVTERVEQENRRRTLEEQLRQSQKLEAIGQLAGGVAHDFNNLLLGIRGYGELALRRIERGEPDAAADIRDMLDAADRATELTRQLLAFGRRQVLQPEVVDLREVVQSMEKLLQRLAGEHVELTTICDDEPVSVEADRSQLEQVLANLVVNARDAMADGGRVTVTVSAEPQRSEAKLSVADTGCGMRPDVAARVFEPFFTTKGDCGNGLGLATVHGIVSQSGGRIELETESGRGSTFTISLPLTRGAPETPEFAPPAVVDGAETVLVVEDDPVVRSIVIAMLEDRGYRVLGADGGSAAVEVASNAAEIDLLLTDLVMPGLNGREAAEHVRELFPAVKVLYMSGYTDDLVIRSGAFEPGASYIQKPFDGEQLARRVREALEVEVA